MGHLGMKWGGRAQFASCPQTTRSSRIMSQIITEYFSQNQGFNRKYSSQKCHQLLPLNSSLLCHFTPVFSVPRKHSQLKRCVFFYIFWAPQGTEDLWESHRSLLFTVLFPELCLPVFSPFISSKHQEYTFGLYFQFTGLLRLIFYWLKMRIITIFKSEGTFLESHISLSCPFMCRPLELASFVSSILSLAGNSYQNIFLTFVAQCCLRESHKFTTATIFFRYHR